MSLFNLNFAKFFRSSAPISINVPVCKSISHFNWFARYDEFTEAGTSHYYPKITTLPKL
jgi:hypothetical protein